MSFYTKFALRTLGRYIEPHLNLFSELKKDLKKSRMRISLEEYLASSILTCLLLFIIELPLFSFILSLLRLGVFFSVLMATVLSIFISVIFFLLFRSYPKFTIRDRKRAIDTTLPFATIYLSTIASSGLPMFKVFEIFSKFKEHGEVSKEAERIVTDMKAFGLNVYDSLERAVERTPSEEFRDLLWSILSTVRAGGDIPTYLSEKAKSFLNTYRRKLSEFAHSLSIYLEIYLTVLVLGAIFFTILTSVMTGIGGVSKMNIVFIQFFLIFFFIPLVSFAFIVLIKMASPGGE